MEVKHMGKPLFDVMKNGYNRYQVDDYLNTLKHQVDVLNQEVETYRNRGEEVERQLHVIKEKYQFVVDGLHAKEKVADEMARIAMKEANVVVDTAQHNADVIIKEALMTARSILLDITKLGNEATELKGSMQEQLQDLSMALDAFEVPAIPDLDLLKRNDEIQ